MQEEAEQIKLRESTPELQEKDAGDSESSTIVAAAGSSPGASPGFEELPGSSEAPRAEPPNYKQEDADILSMDAPPGLESTWIPIGRQYQIDLPMAPARFTQLIESICYQRKGDRQEMPNYDKPLAGRVDSTSFELHRRSDFLSMLFQPAIEGRYELHNGFTRVRVLTKLRPGTQKLLYTAPAAVIGAALAAVASSYMLPHVVALLYSFIATVTIPIVMTIVCFFVARMIVPVDLRYMLNLIRKNAGLKENYDQVFSPWPDLKPKGVLTDELKAGAIAVGVYLVAAVATHGVAWTFWCDGKYEESAKLCLPGVQLSQVVLGRDSGAVADARYYLAECYRCMGKLEDAEKLYRDSLKTWASSIGKEHPFLADGEFNLARVYEQQGKFDLADEHYLQAAKIWQWSFGLESMAISRTYDRIATNLAKQNKIDEAIDLMNKAIAIDKRYGNSAGRSVGEDLNDLAALKIRKAQFAEAESLLTEALKLKKVQVGEHGYSLVPTLLNLSSVHRAIGNTNLAESELKKAREILDIHMRRLKLTPTGDIYNDLKAVLHRHQNDYEPPVFDTRSDNTENLKAGRL